MISGIYAILVASALGQAPEAAWLKDIPGDVDVVAYCRGVETGQKDLSAMLQAMSPMLARQAQGALQQGIDQVRNRYGQVSVESPFLAAAEFPAVGWPFASLGRHSPGV